MSDETARQRREQLEPLLDASPDRAFERAIAGRYQIVRKLGAGGMATVYLAKDLRIDREVALKVLLPDLSHSVGAERFAREVRLAGTLQHPSIVGVLDSGEADGHLWYAMPVINGESLRQRIAREGQLPLDDTLSILSQTASAIAFAHARGIIHRDIKPDNILLSGDTAYVADFGIARALESAGDTLTRTGMSVGTPAYMAPEQAAGEKELDTRVDVYALAAVLYEMLAGTPAFTGPSPQAIIVRAMTTDPQPIHPIRTAVTHALDAVILKGMARTPADRYTSIDAFREAAALAAVTTLGASSAPPRRWKTRYAVMGGAAVVAFAAVAAMMLVRSGASAPPRVAVLAFENRTRDTTAAYLADGFTEEVGNRLTRVPQLNVVSNTAVRRLRAPASTPLKEIGRELNASHLLSGSIQRTGGRLLVTAELTRASDGERVWSERYDRPESGLPHLVRDVSLGAAGGLLGGISADIRAQVAAPTENSEAYDLYLRGSRTRFAEGATGLQHAIGSFEAALVLDPSFAAAQGRLASVYARSLVWSVALPGIPPDTAMARGASAASRALELDSASAEAWAGRATILFYRREPDYAGAVTAVGRAAALDSTNPGVHQLRGQILRRLGDFPGAEEATRRALIADPRFDPASNQAALLALSTRRFDEARAWADSAIAVAPDQWQYWENRARIHIARKDTANARSDAEVALRLAPANQHDYATLVMGQVLAFSGDTASAASILVPIISRIPRDGPLTPRSYQAAAAMLSIGRREEALQTLERIRPRGAWLWSYLIMPAFDPIRSTPRFEKIFEESRPSGSLAMPR